MQRYLSSRDPNVHYAVLSFLQCLPPSLWSNEAEDSSSQGEEASGSVFREGDVKLLMSNLDSSDILLRKKVRVRCMCLYEMLIHMNTRHYPFSIA
jgi:hypothetical protein